EPGSNAAGLFYVFTGQLTNCANNANRATGGASGTGFKGPWQRLGSTTGGRTRCLSHGVGQPSVISTPAIRRLNPPASNWPPALYAALSLPAGGEPLAWLPGATCADARARFFLYAIVQRGLRTPADTTPLIIAPSSSRALNHSTRSE
ncbi:hypothetical protein, partial [Camelimonas fluminis]